MVAPVRPTQLLDLPVEVLEIVMLKKNPGQLALVCSKFREIANGDALYFFYLVQLRQRLGIPGYRALLGRLSIIEGPTNYVKNGNPLSLKGVMKEIFVDQKTRIATHWGGKKFTEALRIRFQDNVFDPLRYFVAENWLDQQDQNRSLRVQEIKSRFRSYTPLLTSAAVSTAMTCHIQNKTPSCEFPTQAYTAATSAMFTSSMLSGVTAEMDGQGNSLERHVVGGVVSSIPMAILSKKAAAVGSFYGFLSSTVSSDIYAQEGIEGAGKFTGISIGVSSLFLSLIGSGINFEKQVESGELSASQSDKVLLQDIMEGGKGAVKGVAASVFGWACGGLLGRALDFVVDRPSVRKWL